MPAALRWNLAVPGYLELPSQLVVLHVLEARQPVGNRSHVSAALHIVLPTQRINSAPVASNVPSEKRKIDERQNIVHRVVMFGNAERPAKFRSRRLGIRMRYSANCLGR